MMCKVCSCDESIHLESEMGIHHGLDKPAIFLFAHVVICLQCGFTELTIPDMKLRELRKAITDQSPRLAAS